MNIFAINGVAKSGKDTFCNMVETFAALEDNSIRTISTIDPIKSIYTKHFGWDGDKYKDHHRKNLNTLKQVWISCSNGPHNWTIQKLKELKEEGVDSVFIMVREYEEMMDIIGIGNDFFNGCKAIQIVRFGLPIPPVEKEFLLSYPDNYAYDWTIINPTTEDTEIPDLKSAAKSFWDHRNVDTQAKCVLNERRLPGFFKSYSSLRDQIILHSA